MKLFLVPLVRYTLGYRKFGENTSEETFDKLMKSIRGAFEIPTISESCECFAIYHVYGRPIRISEELLEDFINFFEINSNMYDTLVRIRNNFNEVEKNTNLFLNEIENRNKEKARKICNDAHDAGYLMELRFSIDRTCSDEKIKTWVKILWNQKILKMV